MTTFNVLAAVSTGNTHITVEFDAVPDPAQAGRLSNYSIPGLTLSGGFADLVGNTALITTSAQSSIAYTVTVAGVTRADDAEALTIATAAFTGSGTFNILTAEVLSSTMVLVTFDAAPDQLGLVATDSIEIPGLTISEVFLRDSDAILITSAQDVVIYTATANINVFRALDGMQLTVNSVMFVGRTPFNVVSAVSTGAYQVAITFDAAPATGRVTNNTYYSVPGLTLTGYGVLVGNTVTFQTMTPQTATTYTVSVHGSIARAFDGELLTAKTATFTGRTPFGVASAASLGHQQCSVTFSHAPNAGQATTLSNYATSPGLTLSAAVLVDSTVTFTTSAQSDVLYQIQAFNVTRDSDAEPLTQQRKTFTGTPLSL